MKAKKGVEKSCRLKPVLSSTLATRKKKKKNTAELRRKRTEQCTTRFLSPSIFHRRIFYPFLSDLASERRYYQSDPGSTTSIYSPSRLFLHGLVTPFFVMWFSPVACHFFSFLVPLRQSCTCTVAGFHWTVPRSASLKGFSCKKKKESQLRVRYPALRLPFCVPVYAALLPFFNNEPQPTSPLITLLREVRFQPRMLKYMTVIVTMTEVD